MKHTAESTDNNHPEIVNDAGQPIQREPESQRREEREVEDQSYTPVIIKRNDETFRHADDILESAIEEGISQLERPLASLFMSAISAGLILGFTVLAVGVMATLFEEPFKGLSRLALAAIYPVGFVLCILSRTQLFTEHTATAVYPVLDRQGSLSNLLRLWLFVIAGNLLGGAISATLLTLAEEVLGAANGYTLLAEHILHFSPLTLLVSAVLAGWLMALGAWIILSTNSSTSQIMSIYLVTFTIGLGGLHHSIAGSAELFAAIFTGAALDGAKTLSAIGIMLTGNLLGGSVFVALINYSHIRSLNR